jgi:hypothetical protein
MAEYDATTWCVWDPVEDPTLYDKIMQGKGRPRRMSDNLKNWIHSFIYDNVGQLEDYRQ